MAYFTKNIALDMKIISKILKAIRLVSIPLYSHSNVETINVKLFYRFEEMSINFIFLLFSFILSSVCLYISKNARKLNIFVYHH